LFYLMVFFSGCFPVVSQGQVNIQDKTLVVWVSPDNLTQTGGSALTIDDGHGNFDGIVFGEIEKSRWMAGSNNFKRTEKEQSSYPVETVTRKDYVQIAVVYRGSNISIFRNGLPYAGYKIQERQEFDTVDCTVMFGRRHLDVSNANNSFEGRIRDARIYNEALDQGTIIKLNPGSIQFGPQPWAWWDFKRNGLQDVTRKFAQFKLIGDAFLKDGNLVLKGKGASLIVTRGDLESVWDNTQAVSKEIVRNTRLFREKLLLDPYRPAYHFCVPEDRGLPGDPNGAFYHEGRYHLMYLYNREGIGFSWGHVSSTDMLHWRHHLDAIGPGDGDEGCFSGGGFVDDDGKAILSYWMLWGDKGIGLATSKDPGFNVWQKAKDNPVIKSTEWGVTEMKDEEGKDMYIGSADPSNIWKKDGKYYLLTGNLLVLNKIGRKPDSPANEQGDRLYLFESEDLVNWDYKHRFYDSNRKWTEASEDNMCPSFLPLPSSPDGGPASDKHLLLFISHNLGCQYYIGSYSNDRFFPENHGRMTWIDNAYFAPEALIDGQGRQIMWSWIFDDRPDKMKSEYGWTGTYGIPRSLWLNEDGTLGIQAVKELQALRLDEKMISDIELTPTSEIVLDTLGKQLMEIEFVINLQESETLGIDICVSKDGSERTVIKYDRNEKKLLVDTNFSSLEYGRKTIESAPLDLKEGEPLVLKIFTDRSVVEVFANDRQAIARRIYPTLGGTGIRVYAENGNAKILKMRRWELTPSNPY